MKEKASSFLPRVTALYFKSLKPFYSEELAGVFPFRPAGFLVALLSRSLHVTPNMLSVIRGILGICSIFLLITGTRESIFYGACILIASNVFDCADGQLARITGRTTRLGIILDGIGDGISFISVYVGTAAALFRQNPRTGLYWWILMFAAFFCFLMHIYTQGFLRFEYFLYSLNFTTEYTFDDIQSSRDAIAELRKKIKAEKKIYLKIMHTCILYLNLCQYLASRLVLIKRYKGYSIFYKNGHDIPEQKRALFKSNYEKNNGWILLLFNNVGLLSNQLIFIITGLFNRLDMAFYIILLASNLYFLICVMIQRISFSIQIGKIK